MADAIDWAWDQGQSDVLSNSWSFTNPNDEFDAITQAITRARTLGRGGLGSVVVFASGNSQQSFNGVVMFPARADGVVTVGAIDRSGNIWNYSSRGAQMDLVAPSGNVNNTGDIRTTDRMGNNGLVAGNYVTSFGGTSAACPQVSAVAALVISTNPALPEEFIVNILRNTATDMGSAGFDNTFGFGRLNAQAAVNAVLPVITPASLVCSSTSFAFAQPPGTTVTWFSSNTNALIITSAGTSNGTASATVTRQNNYSGPAQIWAIVNGGCGSAQVPPVNVWVGAPTLVNLTVNGSQSLPGQVCFGGGNVFETQLHPSYPPNLYSYISWSGTNVNLNSWGSTTTQVSYNGTIGDYAIVSVTATNACETWEGTYTWMGEIIDCGGGGSETWAIYPNPASSYLIVELTDSLSNENENENVTSPDQFYQLELFDKFSQKIFSSHSSNRKTQVSLDGIPNGIYYLNIYQKNTALRKQVVIKK